MTGDWFVDTNVFIYVHDSTEPEKQRAASTWVEWLWRTRRGQVSVQVLQEFYNAATRRLTNPLSREAAQARVRQLFAWRPIPMGTEVLEAAWAVQDRYGLSWWDSLSVGAAQRAGCQYLLTEDLQTGQDLGGVVVVNPFVQSPEA
jgi:predicted nucleic acid-binding protein